MASTDKELEEQLLEAGNKLVDPPSSVDELLPLLDQVESCLSKVEQSPTESMQNALSPSLKALIADKLLRHSDVDVKIAVASCISEITRITAPDAPYDDDQMKEVFGLIVSSFENLYDKSSRSYAKRTMILETVAKVRSCVVMLDLECDALILEMFQHFLKTIREHHPENVFSSMETVMTLVLEESEDISLDLLSPILASLKKDNEEVPPIARNLGERVLESCATRLKPYIVQAVKTLGISLDDYSDVLASICQDTSGSVEQNDEDESKSEKEPLEESAQVVRENAKETTQPQEDNPVGDRSPKSVMSNGVAQAGEDDALVDSNSQKKQDDTDHSILSKGINLSVNEEPNDLDTEKVGNSEPKPEQATKRKGRKPSSLKLAKFSESYLAKEKDAEKMIDSKSHSKDVPSSPHEDNCAEAAGPSENDNEVDTKISSPKAGDGESDVVASPSPNEGIHNEKRSKKRGRTKKKDSSAKEVAAEDVLKKLSEGTSDSEAKPISSSMKKGLGRSSDVKKTVVDVVKMGSSSTSDPDAEKHTAKKTEERNKGGGGSFSRQSEDKKRKGRGKANSEKGVAKSSAKDDDKEMMSSPKSAMKSTKDEPSEETPKTNLKRKRTGKENESNTKKYGQNLVGSRVEVWWPDDQMFYEGTVDSFDPAMKKHKVLYDDGDEEILNLKKEKWKIIEAGADSDGEEGSDRRSPDASSDKPLKKKGKTSAGESKKEGKRDSSSKSIGGATPSKSKGAPMKSSHKSKDGSKSVRKSKDSKTVGKSEDEVSRKSKDHSLKSGGGKSIDAAQKSKSKNTDNSKISKSKDDVGTPKSSVKSKKETSKTEKSKQEKSKAASASKAKSTKSGGKSNANGTGKVKSHLLKRKDSENENSEDSTEEVENTKGKTSSSLKAGSEVKSGKKRSHLFKTNDSEDENTEDSTEDVEDTKGKTSISLKTGSEAKSGKKRGHFLKTRDSENENSEDSTEDVEDMKGKTSSSLKAGSEAKSGKKRGHFLKTKDSENENSEDSTKEVEDTKGKTSSSWKAGSDAKSGKKRPRN
ncbi:sister chromatid cohesion protein PDS5 homolog C-like isoform X2 [Gastrolobium bilobum]|uniref:sister chromatid cohesion protein PDS5 homolog C-like isoform X2 n=1 Tax=Gastrolobium bilobum TaxID=150636 RepID=UPI002AAF918A|nr:sister chromatid cohesion protein PDS5 homolog C-like isoform X2 [Gastrolobium bilobum]